MKPQSLLTSALERVPVPESWLDTPATTEMQLSRLEAVSKRIDGHVRFICAVEHMAGTSVEAKTEAVARFHEQLAATDRDLAHIQHSLVGSRSPRTRRRPRTND